MRYVLHYLNINKNYTIKDQCRDDYHSSWQKMECKTLKEAKEYAALVERYYIIDNITLKVVAISEGLNATNFIDKLRKIK